MTLGIDTASLNAAAQVAMDQAVASGRHIVDSDTVPDGTYDLSRIEDVRRFLRDRAVSEYDELAGAIQPGLIVSVPYRSVGLVFEAAPARWAPRDSIEVLGPPGTAPKHLATFWRPLR